VPKVPTLDPTIKRLAVQVEDHPIAYASFHGDIPVGEYGAGHVEIWDSGTYHALGVDGSQEIDAEGLEKGRIEFVLEGEKLRGRYTLVRMKNRGEKNWLLIKSKDEHAASDPEAAAARVTKRARGASKDGVAPASSRARAARSGRAPAVVSRTNEEKIYFPGKGYTKGDLLDFYERIAPWLLPHLKDRPVTLERAPGGIIGPSSPHFWQKDTPEDYPSWISRVTLETERGEPVSYALVNDPQSLLYLVNKGTITFHVWMSRLKNLDRPDFVLFDLDPGTRPFSDVVTVAKEVHAVLKKEKLEGFVKTSGKSGLHVLTPWLEKGNDQVAREWAMDIAELVVSRVPDIATVERSKERREGKLYLDTLQNIRGHHVVPPYVVRAIPDATVSTPLRWNELTSELTPKKFDMKSIFNRLSRQRVDPIAGLAPTTRPKK
jgi:bifunctional non-homologous end joining protein LigD